MKINYNQVPDIFKPQPNPIQKGPGKLFCLNCKKTMDQRQFFKTGRLNKFPNGYIPHCRTCVTMGIVDTDPNTFLSILKELDLPYIPSEWRGLLVKKDPRAGSIIGKYSSKMRLNQFKKYKWIDSQRLAEEEEKALLAALRQESSSETEAEDKLREMMTMEDIPVQRMTNAPPPGPVGAATTQTMYGLTPETSKYNLTQEEIDEILLEWGDGYTEQQFFALEQLYSDMREAYVIQDPVAMSNAKIICKMTVKMNEYLDMGDIESVSKLSRQLDLFVKTANLAPVQQKDRQQTTFAISQVAFLVEKEGGFVPKYHQTDQGDRIDMMLKDLKDYTEYLVRGETNIAEMVENTEAILAQQPLPEAVEDMDDFQILEAELLGEMEAIEEAQDDVISN